MKPQDLLVGELAPILREAGFRKERSTWRRAEAETILVLNLQKSSWGENFFINLGVYFRVLGPEQKPPAHRCHLGCRAEAIPEAMPLLSRALDFDPPTGVSEEERRSAVREIAGHALSWLRARRTVDGARLEHQAESHTRCLVHTEARDLLGLSSIR